MELLGLSNTYFCQVRCKILFGDFAFFANYLGALCVKHSRKGEKNARKDRKAEFYLGQHHMMCLMGHPQKVTCTNETTQSLIRLQRPLLQTRGSYAPNETALVCAPRLRPTR